jgi:hypothetical protein
MGVSVYPRLGELLHARHLTVVELERQIERRFGLSVDPKTLYRLTAADPIQRADLEIAGAVAAVLGVGLNDLFDVHAIPTDGDERATADLDPHQSRRLSELFDRQAHSTLSQAEQDELEALVTEYSWRLHEHRLREIAKQRGISLDEARAISSAGLADALAWWQAFEDTPKNRADIAARIRRRRRRRATA